LSTQTTSTQIITAEISITAPVAQLYYLVSTRSGWLDWFADKAFGHVGSQGILQMYYQKVGHIALIFKKFVQDESVSFTTLDPETMETSDVEISFAADDGQVTISVAQSGLDGEIAAKWQKVWQENLDSLKEIFETGKDPRTWNRPFLGVTVEEWVSTEYAAEHGLGVESGMHLNSVFEGKGAQQAGMRAGDVLISLAGIEIVDYEALMLVYQDHKAGATIPVVYYQDGEIFESELTLSSYPVPDVPATTQDMADNLDAFFHKANKKIAQLLEGQTEAQTSYRPAAGEWNAKEIIAHMIAAESDSVGWLGSYIAGREVYPYTSGVPARIKMITSLYPTMDALLKKMGETQKELVAMVREVPAEVSGRKTSLLRLAFAYSFDISLHYRDHLNQLKETLEMAADVRPS
jgi:hypothetical protein